MLRVDANLSGKLVAQTFAQAVPTLLNGLIVMGKIGIIRRIDQKRPEGSFSLRSNRCTEVSRRYSLGVWCISMRKCRLKWDSVSDDPDVNLEGVTRKLS